MDTMPHTKGATEHCVVGFTDGSIKIISKFGKVEKVMADAHKKAVTAQKWSHDAQTLLSAGEDGVLKVSLLLLKQKRFGQNLEC